MMILLVLSALLGLHLKLHLSVENAAGQGVSDVGHQRGLGQSGADAEREWAWLAARARARQRVQPAGRLRLVVVGQWARATPLQLTQSLRCSALWPYNGGSLHTVAQCARLVSPFALHQRLSARNWPGSSLALVALS